MLPRSAPNILLGTFLLSCLFFTLVHSRSHHIPRLSNAFCAFQSRNCSWTFTGTDWNWTQPAIDGIQLDGPPTSSTPVLLANLKSAHPIEITSPPITPEKNISCFNFQYYIADNVALDSAVTLFLITDPNTISEIWSTGASMVTIDKWKSAAVQLKQVGSFRLKFSAHGHTGFVGLNYFAYHDGECQVNECTFETDNCGWTASTAGPFQFRRVKAGEETTSSTSTGRILQKKGDHTTRSPSGHVQRVTNVAGVTGVGGQTARLVSPALDHAQEQCLSFWFLTTGPGIELRLLSALKQDTPKETVLWKSNGTAYLANEWVQVQNSFTVENMMNFVLQATVIDNHSNSTLQIDDIAFDPGDCDEIVSCEFTDFCAWNEETTANQLLWSVGRGRVADASRLNLTSLNNLNSWTQSFLYTDFTTLPKGSTSKSMELDSEFVDAPPGGACVRLRYFVATFSFDTDAFHLDQIDVKGNRKTIWTFSDSSQLSETQGLELYVPNPSQNQSYRLSLVAKSSHPSTYINVFRLFYTDDQSACKGATRPPVTTTTTTISPSVTLNCNFEANTLCNWKPQDSSLQEFKLGSAQQSTEVDPMYSPVVDHTKRTADGHFVYHYNSNQFAATRGVLRAVNPFPKQTICFSFYFFLYASMPSSFVVTLDGAQRSVAVFRGYGANEIRWRGAYFTVRQNDTFDYISFRSEIQRGILAIDDIVVTPGECSSMNHDFKYCDFEDDSTCVLEPVVNRNNLKWQVFQADSFATDLVDHTTRTREGHFYGMDLTKMDIKNKLAHVFEVETSKLSVNTIHCFRFSYLMEAVLPTTTLYYEIMFNSDQVVDSMYQQRIWQVNGPTLGMWFTHLNRLSLPDKATGFKLRIGFDTLRQMDNGRIFIDDVMLDSGSCAVVEKCDFEAGDLCTLEAILPGKKHLDPITKEAMTKSLVLTREILSFLTDFADDTWHVYSPHQRPSSAKFVQKDNSYRTSEGKYLLFVGREEFDRGIVVTERYSLERRSNQSVCLSLAVYKPDDQASVAVYQGEAKYPKAVKLWQLTDSTKGRWLMYNIKAVPRDSQSSDLFFFIVGTVFKTSSYIAIDDVSTAGDCSEPSNVSPTAYPPTGPTEDPSVIDANSFTCLSGKVIPSQKLCNWVNDCEHGEDEKYCGTCDFSNHSLCRYTVTSSPLYKFLFSDQATVGPDHGSHDNALFMVASGKYGSATLTSPVIHQAYLMCDFSFSYYFNSSDLHYDTESDRAMTVYLELTDLNTKVAIWQSNFQPLSMNQWTMVEFNTRRVKHPFQVSFVANNLKFTGNRVYHAVDNVKMAYCEPLKPESSDCGRFQFTCRNKVCLHKSDLCDFEDDCGDESDEQNCDQTKMTSFENGFGRWGENLHNGWKIMKADTQSDLRQAPTYDHTAGYNHGSYLYTDTSAEIDSPPFVSKTSCFLKFFIMKNSNAATLMVILHNLVTGKKTLIREYHKSSYNYQPMTIGLNYGDPAKDIYRIALFASINPAKDNFTKPYIAVDDISFTDGCTVLDSLPTVATLPNHNNSPATTPTPSNCSTITCLSPNGTTVCLGPNQFCDFIADCSNGVDERNCGNCNFDDGHTCQWSSNGFISYWKMVKPASDSAGLLPKLDADNHANGSFVSIFSSVYTSSLQYVSLRSPRINGKTHPMCSLRFSFFSDQGASLLVKASVGGSAYLLLGKLVVAHQWQTVQMEVGPQSAGFTIDISGSSTHQYGAFEDIAIDNIELINCDPNKQPPQPTDRNSSSTSISCDFENDLCAWDIIGPTERSKWFRTNSRRLEPGNDHTSLTVPKPPTGKSGTWLTSQAQEDNKYETDYLITTVALKAGQTYCLSFWFYFFGIEVDSSIALYASRRGGKAAVDPETDRDYLALWYSKMPVTRNWNLKQVEIAPQSTDFYLVFVGKVSTTTVMGLDDIALVNGTCPVLTSEYCDFEVNTCDWTRSDKSGWQRNTSPLANKYLDHTTGTLNGHYLMQTAESNSPNSTISKPMSTVPIFAHAAKTGFLRTRTFCLQMFYYWDTDWKLEDNTSRLMIRVNHPPALASGPSSFNYSVIDNYNEGYTHSWSMVQFQFRATARSSLEIGAVIGHDYTKLLIDDISVENRVCEMGGNCDFETDMCGWVTRFGWIGSPLVGNKRVLWLRIKPNNLFVHGTHLKFDHTLGTAEGNYLIWPSEMQDHASSVLQSPLLHRRSLKLCLTLHYFARGRTNRTPAFLLRLVDLSRRTNTAVWVNATTELRGWTRFDAEFHNLPAVFYFQIESNYNPDIMSDIGLDDIRIERSGCGDQSPEDPYNQPSTTPVPLKERLLNCNFDRPPCFWQFDNTTWNVTAGNDQNNKYAPRLDHTFHYTLGKYLLFTKQFADGSSVSPTGYSVTATEPLVYDKDHCLTFWYYEDGEGPFTLMVHNKPGTLSHVVTEYSSTIENRRRWNLVKADIPYSPNYNANVSTVVITYLPTVARHQQFSIFAIDDIAVQPGQCQHRFDYTYTFTASFEDLEYETIQPLSGRIGDIVSPASDHIADGAPPVDHTINTAQGSYFLFMNAPDKLVATTYISTLTVLDLPADKSDTCVRFAYQLRGDVTFKVVLLYDYDYGTEYRSEDTLWKAVSPKDSWTIVEFNKNAPYKHKIVFYMEKQADKTSFLALDDLTVLGHKCEAPIDCDFENANICSYSPYNSKFNFGVVTVPPADSNWPGPRYDHSTGIYGGGYLYLTAYRFTGAFSQIVSKVISGTRTVNATDAYCLSMWTALNSVDLGLRLSVVRFGPGWSDANRTAPIATVQNVNQTTWTLLSVTLNQALLANTVEIQLLIEGRLGANARGAIAIDDILVTRGECLSGDLVTCEDGTPLRRDQICDFVADCPSGLDEQNCGDACDFEDGGGLCGWSNVTDARPPANGLTVQYWRRAIGTLAGNSRAPKLDGSGNATGHYMLVSVPQQGLAAVAEMALNSQTPRWFLKKAFRSCVLRFDYFVQTEGAFAISVAVGADVANWDTIYRVQSNTAVGVWREGYAHVGAHFTPFMADISGYLADGRNGAVAVDNVRFVNCSMPAALPANGTCGSGGFLCPRYRYCVAAADLCDYVNDCGNGEDEQGCAAYPKRCNFEDALYTCGIQTDNMIGGESESRVQWSPVMAKYYPDGYTPKIDNTLRTAYGHFIGLQPKFRPSKTSKSMSAEFYSPMMTTASDGQSCGLRFFYFINGDPVRIPLSSLKVLVRFADQLTAEPAPLLTITIGVLEDLQQRWNKAVVGFRSVRPFQFVFRGFLGSDETRIALDDISFERSCVPSSVRPRTPPPPTIATLPTTTAASNPSTGTQSPESPTTDVSAPIGRRNEHSPAGGKIAAAVLVPVFVVVGVALGYIAVRRYRRTQRFSDSISMRGIISRSGGNAH